MKPPKILPPHYFFLSLIAMVGLDYMDPTTITVGSWHLTGLVSIAVGIILLAQAARQFSKADTNIVPLTKSSALVTDGIFSVTRNPMYTGMTSALVGSALLLNSYLPWLTIIPFVLVIRLLFIRREETLMEETFGKDYLAYKSRVRRWL